MANDAILNVRSRSQVVFFISGWPGNESYITCIARARAAPGPRDPTLSRQARVRAGHETNILSMLASAFQSIIGGFRVYWAGPGYGYHTLAAQYSTVVPAPVPTIARGRGEGGVRRLSTHATRQKHAWHGTSSVSQVSLWLLLFLFMAGRR